MLNPTGKRQTLRAYARMAHMLLTPCRSRVMYAGEQQGGVSRVLRSYSSSSSYQVPGTYIQSHHSSSALVSEERMHVYTASKTVSATHPPRRKYVDSRLRSRSIGVVDAARCSQVEWGKACGTDQPAGMSAFLPPHLQHCCIIAHCRLLSKRVPAGYWSPVD